MIRTLQAGRAIAAFSVLAFHLSVTMGLERYGGVAVFREYTILGNRGVDFFFVLSGFIILFAHYDDINKPAAWGRYVNRRFIRLFPIYWLYTLAFVLAFMVARTADSTIPSNFVEWLTAITLIRFSDVDTPLAVAWSLFYELTFYALFSLLILNRMLGVAVMSLFMLVALVATQYPEVQGESALRVYTAGYNLYFLFGMGAYLLHRRGGNGIVETIIGLILSYFALTTSLIVERYSLLLLAAGFAVLLSGVTKLELSGRLQIPRWLAFIGDASYSIYLTHLACQGLLLKILMKTSVTATVGPELTYLLVLGGALGLGCLAYVWVEKPLLNILRTRQQRVKAAA